MSKEAGTKKERRKEMNSVRFSLIVAVVLWLAVPACAYDRGDYVDIKIVPDKGATLTTIPDRSYFSGRTHVVKRYLVARRGAHYSIVIRNPMSERIGVVIAVDGRNIISGRKSCLGSNEEMYVIDPYGSAKLSGWRTDDHTVHRFYFTNRADSYSAKTFGDISALGVIAVAVFREKDSPVLLYDESFRKITPLPSAGASAETRSNKHKSEPAGTGFGTRRHSPVVKVSFEPETDAREKILVKYEWRDVLCRKGLLICREEEGNRLWDEDKYAPFPPGYGSR